nr:uncharacterized protein LOC106686976 [Halyomorpha halys]
MVKSIFAKPWRLIHTDGFPPSYSSGGESYFKVYKLSSGYSWQQLALTTLTMNKLIIALLLCSLTTSLARYVAIPVEDIMDVEALERIRMPREVEAIGALRGPREASPTSSEPREYVDFGAHTGARGSYGWYVDYPVRKSQ